MGFQLLAAIIIGVLIGKKIDSYYANETPYATAAGALFGIIVGFYSVLKDLLL